ncbi:MAG: hypothetical protein KH415_17410 [Clostridium sp.]|nr:hypothetical protein [Clostridium sp.]
MKVSPSRNDSVAEKYISLILLSLILFIETTIPPITPPIQITALTDPRTALLSLLLESIIARRTVAILYGIT